MSAIPNHKALWRQVKRKPRPPGTSKSLKANAGPEVTQRMLKQNLRKAVMYENKPRPIARGNSQTIVSEGYKKLLTN